MNAKTINNNLEVNRYLKKFILTTNSLSFDEFDDEIMNTIKQLDEIPFDSDWNYLMTLVQHIEQYFKFSGFTSDANYFRFETGDQYNIQDKQPTKMRAIYSCCVLAIKKYWKEGHSITHERGNEPFDGENL